MEYTDQQLIKQVESLPTFKGWKGVIDVWVRSRADKFNIFDDKVYTFDATTGEPKFKIVCTGTSNAGKAGLLGFHKYNSKGCAVLCSDIIVYNSHVYGLHKGKIPAYIQSDIPFPYTRDNDRDQKAENYGKVYYDRIGANCHPAGIFSQFIENWSIACLVRNQRQQYNEWLKFMNKRPLSVCILDEF